MKWSVLGASGFIGSHFVEFLRQQNYDVQPITNNLDDYIGTNLGNVIYAIGLTSDFRQRPLDTVEAHVCVLKKLLAANKFDSLLYLSSTRVYSGSDSTNELATLSVRPDDPSDLYNISKLMGESLCLTAGNERVRIARLSNIVGASDLTNNFIDSLIADALTGSLTLKTSLGSEKDYLFIDDLMPQLQNVVLRGKHKIYNLASGTNTTNQKIVQMLKQKFRCSVDVDPDAKTWTFIPIDVDRIKTEFDFLAPSFEQKFEKMIAADSDFESH